jgi:hypothetical protein
VNQRGADPRAARRAVLPHGGQSRASLACAAVTTRRHALAALLAAALACAAPAAALAQNAGDEQYADPFGKVESKKKSSGGGQQGASGQGQGTSTPSQQPTQSSGSQAPTAAPAQTLPVTGLPAGVLAAAGLALLGSGAALRRASELPR